MPTIEDIRTWRGRSVVAPDGSKIGTIEDIYLDRHSGEPEWAAIKTGLFGSSARASASSPRPAPTLRACRPEPLTPRAASHATRLGFGFRSAHGMSSALDAVP